MDLAQTTADSSASASASSPPLSCKMDELIRNMHVERASLATIQALRQSGKKCQFPHALSSLNRLRHANPGMDIYLWLKVESSGNLSLCGLLVPRDSRPPIACCVSNTIHSGNTCYYDFEKLLLRWAKLSSDPSHANMYQLVCDANPCTDRDIYEHFFLFQPIPGSILQRIKRIKSVKFNVPGSDGTQTLEYIPDDHDSLDEFVKNISLENTPSTCTHRALQWSVEKAISAQQKKHQSYLTFLEGLITGPLGFDSIDSFNKFNDSIKKIKIFAIEHTERADPCINPYYGNAGPAFVISHFDSLVLLETPVVTSQMTVIDVEGGVASSHFMLAMALLVDLLRCLKRTQCLKCVNDLMELVPHDRFVRFLNEKGYTLAQGDRSKFLDSVYNTLLRDVRKFYRCPHGLEDYIFNYSAFARQCDSGGVSRVKARSLPKCPACKLRLHPKDPSQLQISFTGIDEYYAISPVFLKGMSPPSMCPISLSRCCPPLVTKSTCHPVIVTALKLKISSSTSTFHLTA